MSSLAFSQLNGLFWGNNQRQSLTSGVRWWNGTATQPGALWVKLSLKFFNITEPEKNDRATDDFHVAADIRRLNNSIQLGFFWKVFLARTAQKENSVAKLPFFLFFSPSLFLVLGLPRRRHVSWGLFVWSTRCRWAHVGFCDFFCAIACSLGKPTFLLCCRQWVLGPHERQINL